MTQFQIETCILYEDSDILVCRKPTGLAVQNARMGTMDLESGLKNHLALKQPDQIPYLAVIHRLDQPVEGILVFAKTPAAAKELNRQMTAGEMEKYYLAVTDRKPALPEGILEDELRKDGKTNTSQVVSKGTAGAKHARLSYRLWAELSDTRTRSGKGICWRSIWIPAAIIRSVSRCPTPACRCWGTVNTIRRTGAVCRWDFALIDWIFFIRFPKS